MPKFSLAAQKIRVDQNLGGAAASLAPPGPYAYGDEFLMCGQFRFSTIVYAELKPINLFPKVNPLVLGLKLFEMISLVILFVVCLLVSFLSAQIYCHTFTNFCGAVSTNGIIF